MTDITVKGRKKKQFTNSPTNTSSSIINSPARENKRDGRKTLTIRVENSLDIGKLHQRRNPN